MPRLQRGVDDLNHAAPFALRLVPAEAEIGHQLAERFQAPQIFRLILFREFDDQYCIRVAADGGGDDRLEHRDLAAERQHGAIDQLDGNRAKLYQMLGGVHRLVEAAEMADAEHLVADHRPELELDLGGEGECALRADQKMRHVVRRIARHQRVQIVAADAALHLRESRGDLRCFAATEREHVGKQIKSAVGGIYPREIARHLAEMQHPAVGQGGIHRECVVAHGAVAQRAPTARIIAGHAADGGARGGGDIDRKPQAVLLELPVEVVEHDARLDDANAVGNVERDDTVEMFGDIDDNAVIDGLATLRGSAAARGDSSVLVAGDRQRPQRLIHGTGNHDPRRHDLIERRVGRIAAAVERIEQHFARDLAAQPRGKGVVFSRISHFFGPRRRHRFNLK